MTDLGMLPEGLRVLICALQEALIPGGVLPLLSLRGLPQPFWSFDDLSERQGRGMGITGLNISCTLLTGDCHPVTAPGLWSWFPLPTGHLQLQKALLQAALTAKAKVAPYNCLGRDFFS